MICTRWILSQSLLCTSGAVHLFAMDDDLEDDFEPLGEEDPLDAENFNAIDYINRQFPNEASLGGLGLFINQLKAQEHDIEEGIKNAVRRQAALWSPCES